LEKIFDIKIARFTKEKIEAYFKEADLETRKSKTTKERSQIKI
jgi:hypothetical protein